MQKQKIKSDQKQVQGEVAATRKARSKLHNGNLEGDEISVETTSVKTSYQRRTNVVPTFFPATPPYPYPPLSIPINPHAPINASHIV